MEMLRRYGGQAKWESGKGQMLLMNALQRTVLDLVNLSNSSKVYCRFINSLLREIGQWLASDTILTFWHVGHILVTVSMANIKTELERERGKRDLRGEVEERERERKTEIENAKERAGGRERKRRTKNR